MPDTPVHRLPSSGLLIYPCCEQSMFEVPRTDRITWADEQVTCGDAA